MSKIRIYELAKELGVDNKIVIDKAIALGLPGKISHSNSLSEDEADQIRRAVIRQAIGTSPEKQVVTTRVDKLSGATESIVEKRKGNVIRRRKATADDVVEPVAATPVVEQAVSSDPQVSEEVVEEPVVQAVIESQQETPVLEAAPVEPTQPVEAKVEVATEARVVEQPAVITPTPVVEEKKGAGPKVLGKISLPQRRVTAPRTEATRTAGSAAIDYAKATTPAFEEEEERDGGRGAAKKRSKKREFSRGDLLDYEGRDGRVRGRPKGAKGKEGEDKRSTSPEQVQTKASKRVIKMDEAISVGELAKQMSLKSAEVIAKLIELGVMATINQLVDQDTATIVADEFGFQVESTKFDEQDIFKNQAQDAPEQLKTRPPVVTVMGHVDHGKTSLLDAIRKASVAAKEHGGITQHIGAYKVVVGDGRSITFIDTPGHAAFTSMRARGAQVTDVVVLVVAADDGVMPQTIEAINHAKAAGVTIVVAVNKIDKPGVSPDKIKQQLVEHGLQPEDWGGDTMFFGVSALKGTGLKELLEGLLLVAEVKELKANPDRRARGTVIESRQEKGRGTVATVLVQTGTLKVGDIFVAGSGFGRVRSMMDHDGEKVESAGPSTPVELTGFDYVPEAGDDFVVVESDADARQVSQERATVKAAKAQRALGGPVSLEEFARRANSMAAAELNVILKADVAGSVEAVRESMEKLSTAKVRVRVLHAGVGVVSESDVQLAVASKAIIVGFGVRADQRASQVAEAVGVEMRFYRIIYELLEDVKKAMVGMLEPIKQEAKLGRLEVRETFTVPKLGMVAGCFVADGLIRRGAFVRLLRDGRVVFEGKMASLRRFKDDVREVQSGFECGVGLEGYNDIKVGDAIEVYEIRETAASLE
ncbi:MAG: translation initiation factor IF-2 [Oligoflexia bacterium]|nr:translation initiation factor IF-2 [Oligoflexia bacterium]